jgi:hypothetical protein
VLIGIGGVMNDPQAEATVRRIQTDRMRRPRALWCWLTSR